MTKIGETINKLECFQYDAELDINIGYYMLVILTNMIDMAPIATKFGKFKYNQPLMGLCTSGDIFQDIWDDILGDI